MPLLMQSGWLRKVQEEFFAVEQLAGHPCPGAFIFEKPNTKRPGKNSLKGWYDHFRRRVF